MLKVLSSILCDLDPKVKAIGQKAGICDGVPSTSALVVFIFSFKNCNVVLLDANSANIGSNSLAPPASIFTLSTYIGIVIVNSVLCRKILNVYINFLSLTEN